MARPWEYPGWRRVLMQAVMWAVFAGSLGLAHWVSHTRSSTFGRAVRTGAFVVELPDAFNVKVDAPGPDLVADDAAGRRLFVLSKSLDDGPGMLPDNEGDASIAFRGLNVAGILRVRRSLNNASEGGVLETTLLATAIVPKLKCIIVVGLTLGDSQPDQADVVLLRNVAAGIKLAGPASKAPASRPSSGRDVEQTVMTSRL